MEYIQLLRHPFWQKKSSDIKNRDGWKCRRCTDTITNLQVHHLWYKPNTMPWEYPDDAFITLCELCHEKAEFVKWLFKQGQVALIRLGLIAEDRQEVTQMIIRRVEGNHYPTDVRRYMLDIKKQLNG